MEERVRELLQTRIKAQILAEKDDAPIKPLPVARRRLKKVGGGDSDEKENSTNDLNVTRCEPTQSSKRGTRRVLLDDSEEEKDVPAAAPPAMLPALHDAGPALSPIAGKPSPSRDADLHRQQLLDLANDIENLRLSVGGVTPAHDADVDSSAVSEAASTSVQEEAATPVKPALRTEPKDALFVHSPAPASTQQATATAVQSPVAQSPLPVIIETKKLAADEPSEGSVVEHEEGASSDTHAQLEPEERKEQDDPSESANDNFSNNNSGAFYTNEHASDVGIVPTAEASISIDEGADEQAAVAHRLLQDAAIFNSPAQRRDKPAPAAAVDSPVIVRRGGGGRRVVMSDSEEKEAPTAVALAAIPGSTLHIVHTKGDSDADEEEESEVKKDVKVSAIAKKEENENDEEDDEDDEDDEDEEERKRPKNPFVDSEAEEASTPDEKPKARRKSRKSDVWLVDDDAQETVLSEEEDDDDDDDDEEEPAGETLHSESDEEDEDEEAEPEREEELPKTPAKKTATSQPIPQTPVNKISVSTANTPLAHTPGTHFQRGKAALTRSLFAEYNKRVFGSKLDPTMVINWTNKLKTTAGRTLLKRRGDVRFAEVELENKVVDCEEKLRRTLLHELCHAAAWVIDGCSRPPHGNVFWKWAAVAKKSFPHHEVRTCHSYVINFKHHWTCSRCSSVVGRHTKSIKPTDRCACGGELKYQVPVKADGTPRKPTAPNAYTQFVKEKFAVIKAKNPGATHAQVMHKLSEEYKKTPRKGSA